MDDDSASQTGESTGADTSGPTGGAEPVVPHGDGEEAELELLDYPDSVLERLVPAAVVGLVAIVVAVVLLRRRRS